MTPEELATLAPWFREGERYLNGQPIVWAEVCYPTMQRVVQLRTWLDAPIRLIRGPHPHRPEAVDACCPDRSLKEVFMQLCRLTDCAWGVYSGNSFHIDTRAETKPARWMAVHEAERGVLQQHGWQGLGSAPKDGWIYLPWDAPQAFDILAVVLTIAEERAAGRSIVI